MILIYAECTNGSPVCIAAGRDHGEAIAHAFGVIIRIHAGDIDNAPDLRIVKRPDLPDDLAERLNAVVAELPNGAMAQVLYCATGLMLDRQQPEKAAILLVASEMAEEADEREDVRQALIRGVEEVYKGE